MPNILDYTYSGEWRVFTPLGKPIGTLYPSKGTQVAWMRGQVATAQFNLPRSGLRWSTTYLREWNRVEFHHAQIPYVWTGVITDIEPGDADITVSCQSSEILYSKRHTDWLHDLDPDWTIGMAVQDLHRQAVKEYPLGIIPGEIDTNGPTYWSTFYFAPISEALTTLCEASGGDWWVEKLATDGNSEPKLRYARSRGSNKWGTVLLCAEVVDQPSYKRGTPDLVTRVIAIGPKIDVPGGEVNSDAYGPYYNRPVVFCDDKPARKLYGLLEAKIEYEADDPDILAAMGYKDLYDRSRGTKALALNVDNRRDQWGQFWLGDTVRVMAERTGYEGIDLAARVNGIQIDVDSCKMGLVVEVV